MRKRLLKPPTCIRKFKKDNPRFSFFAPSYQHNYRYTDNRIHGHGIIDVLKSIFKSRKSSKGFITSTITGGDEFQRNLIGNTMIFLFIFLIVIFIMAAGIQMARGEILPHDPILIYSDGEFIAENGVTSGNGTIDDPYIIESHQIYITTDWAIRILNTSKRFVIRTCDIQGDGTVYSNGISIQNAVGGRIENVTITNTYYGIYLESTKSLFVTKNTIIDATYGLWSEYENSNCYIDNNLWSSPPVHVMDIGFRIGGGYGSVVDSNHVTGGRLSGIYIFDGAGQELTNNKIEDFDNCGILFRSSLIDNGLWYTGQIFVSGCVLRNISIGIDLFQCRANIENSYFENIRKFGIYIIHGPPVSISKNRFMATKNPIWIERLDSARIELNTLYEGDSTGITIRNSVISIINNRIENRTIGIQLVQVDMGLFCGNELEDNAIGIYIESSGNLNITRNIIIKCYSAGILWQESGNCSVTMNLISSSGIGLDLISSSDIILSHNALENCSDMAVKVRYGFNNFFHHNNFINNNYNETSGKYLGPQATDDATTSTWDDGNEGNYWSDFILRYPDAIGFSGIWDTPYDLGGSGARQDRFPLTEVLDLFPPVAVAGPDQIINQNTTALFDGSASTDDVGIVDFSWVFVYNGTIIRLSGEVYAFEFDIPGTYLVCLSVYDRAGRSSSDTMMVTVIDTQRPFAVLDEDVYIEMGDSFTLDGSASWDNVAITSFIWTIDPSGMNLTFSGPVVSLKLDVPGDYRVVLLICDAAGNVGFGGLIVHVLDTEPPHALAGEDIFVDQGTTVLFDGTGSSDNVAVVNWTWSVRDGSRTILLYGAVASFLFDEPGRYDVILVVMDNQGNSDEDAIKAIVRDVIPPIAEAGNDVEADQGVEILLSGLASHDNVGIISFTWLYNDLGEVHRLRGPEVLIAFQGVGKHEVMLTVEDLGGNTASDAITVTIRDSTPPIAEAGRDLVVGQGTLVLFNGSGSSDNEGVVGYTWMFVEAGTLLIFEGEAYSHTFDLPGDYRVTLLVKDAAGNTGMDGLMLTVTDTEAPTADAGPDREGIESCEMVLDGTGSKDNVGITGYRWIIDEAAALAVLTGPLPTLVFNASGEFTITLEVTDAAGNLAYDTIVVHVLPLRVPWRIGPFTDQFHNPIPDTRVYVLLNGTTGVGRTGSDGWVEITVVRYDIVSPAEISARKVGWKPLDFNMRLGGNGKPLDPIPVMYEEVSFRTEPNIMMWVLSLIFIIIVTVIITWGIRRHRNNRTDKP